MYSVVMSACGKGKQWQQSLSLLSLVPLDKLDVMACGAAMAACAAAGRWLESLACLRRLEEASLEADIVIYNNLMDAMLTSSPA